MKLKGIKWLKGVNWLIPTFATIMTVSIGITIWAVFIRDSTPDLAPDYASPDTEENAEVYDDGADKLEQPKGGGAVNLTYSQNATINLDDRTVSLMFANPSKSNQNMMLQVVVKDTVIVQSGLLKPGYKVEKLNLFDRVKLSKGVYEGKLVVLFYQNDTGEKAMINTEIPMTIEAK